MRRSIISALAFAALAPGAFAQVFVIGGGLGAECYDATKSGKVGFVAEDLCTRALHQEWMSKPNRAATYTNRGIIKMRDGRYDQALEDYDQAEKLDPDQGAIYLNRGAALIYKKQFAEAVGPLNRSIELEAKDLYAAYYNRGVAKENSGDVAGAYYDFAKALELKPEWDMAEQQLARFTVSQQ